MVVVPRIDRLARNLSEGLRTIEELHAQGIYIRSLAEGLDTGDDSSTCCSPWPNGRGRSSGTGSRQAVQLSTAELSMTSDSHKSGSHSVQVIHFSSAFYTCSV